ncbi:MAG TPA: hypothetical protein PLQ56_04620 [Aggregatilineales bacterium]|nr:hypothetical protein [Aggregatilineales bacterium]
MVALLLAALPDTEALIVPAEAAEQHLTTELHHPPSERAARQAERVYNGSVCLSGTQGRTYARNTG